jgi:hypothetical protein
LIGAELTEADDLNREEQFFKSLYKLLYN